MQSLLKQAQNFSKFVASSEKTITIDAVIEAQEIATKATMNARKLYETYTNQ